MASIWVDSLGHALNEALDLLAVAVRECPAELWETPMWPVPAPPPGHQFLDANWKPVVDPAEREVLTRRWIERRSTPWSVAWHALEGFDYDLAGELRPWAPPPPFTGHPHWRDLPALPAAWSPAEILGYVEHCRAQARESLAQMTEERAATPLPPTHRYHGQPHLRIITSLIGHTTEHATQINQFATAQHGVGTGRGAKD